MSSLKEFQKTHGAEWGSIVNSNAFPAALSLAREEKLIGVMLLTDDEIAQNAKIHLAGLRDFLKYENGLLGLHEKKELVFKDVGPETYPDPIVEATENAVFEQEQEAETRAERETQVLTRVTQKKKAAKRGKKR